MPVMAIAAVATTAYTIYSSERANQQAKKDKESADRWTAEQQAKADFKYEEDKAEAAASAQRKFEAETKDYKKKEEYYSGILKDPRQATGWAALDATVNQEQTELSRQMKMQARRSGTTGGALFSALRDIKARSAMTLSDKLMEISAGSKEALANLKTPWLERTPVIDSTVVGRTGRAATDLSGTGKLAGTLAGLATDRTSPGPESLEASTGYQYPGQTAGDTWGGVYGGIGGAASGGGDWNSGYGAYDY